MTKLLDDAFALARQLADDEQDELAQRIIAELTEDDEFDRKIAATAYKLDRLIDEALEEDDAGLTQEWKPLPR
ncbi:MAG: hypothetical protein ACRDJE_21275 [Dehalococcoidia bacterium]